MSGTILIMGHAQLPKGTAGGDHPAVFTVELLVTPTRGEIVDADFLGSTALSRSFLVSLVQGYCLCDGVDGLSQRIRGRLFSASTGAMVQALRSAGERWRAGRGETSDKGQLAQLWK